MNKKTRDIIMIIIQFTATAIIMIQISFKLLDKKIPGFLMGIFLAVMISVVITSLVVLADVILERRKK